jgi:hypothetical protein
MLTIIKYIYAALHNARAVNCCSAQCFVALHNVALQYVAAQHDVALQHRTMLQRSYRSAT